MTVRSRGGAATAVVAVVVLVHAVVLSRWPVPDPPSVRPAAASAPLQVRTVPTMPPTATPARADVGDTPMPPDGGPGAARGAPAGDLRAVPRTSAPPAADVSDTTAPRPPPAERAAAAAPGIPPPRYATRLPPSFEWRYQALQGDSTGGAVLRWTHDGAAFQADLAAEVAGRTVVDWTSRGGIDDHGLAPERFAVRRDGREAHAANFQRDKRLITYAGPATQWPLTDGAQDRLSWMLQLAAIVEADPQRQAPGAEVVLFVTGARGDAAVWRFSVTGVEPVELPGGPRPALRMQRLADGPRPVQAELWLDPQHQHRPIQAVLSVADGGEPLRLRLQSSSAN